MKKFILIVAILAVGLIAVFLVQKKPAPAVVINGNTLTLEVVDTPEKRATGLSGRESLVENTGMLFVFPSIGRLTFHNDQMRFPIDVVWLENNKVVGIERLPVDEGMNVTIESPDNVNRVLELNAGASLSLKLKVNDQIELINLPRNAK